MPKINELTIQIWESDNVEGAFCYNIYDTVDTEGVGEIDGGLCTTTIENALEMAKAQALELIKRSEAE